MGTRHLTCVVKDGEFKVAQYGQWDGYLTGQGHTICDFVMRRLQTPGGLETFKKRVDSVVEVDEKYIRKALAEVGSADGSMTMDQSDEWNKKYPNFSRDFGARILDYVFWNPKAKVVLSQEFAGDSLFCEWCYVIDLDNDVLEIYKGFNQEPVPEGERFHGFKTDENGKYQPVRLWHKVALADIDEDTISTLDTRDSDEERETEEAAS